MSAHPPLVIKFDNEVDLDTVSRKQWESRPRAFGLPPSDVVVCNDQEYDNIKRKMLIQLRTLRSRPEFNDDLEAQIIGAVHEVEGYENILKNGLSMLFENGCRLTCAIWFSKLIRARTVYSLWFHQLRNDTDISDYGRNWQCSRWRDFRDFEKFFGENEFTTVVLWATDRSKPVHIEISKAAATHLLDGSAYHGPRQFPDELLGEVADKYIFPQMLLHYLKFLHREPEPIWNLQEAQVGIA